MNSDLIHQIVNLKIVSYWRMLIEIKRVLFLIKIFHIFFIKWNAKRFERYFINFISKSLNSIDIKIIELFRPIYKRIVNIGT